MIFIDWESYRKMPKPVGYWIRSSGSLKAAFRRPTLWERIWMWAWNDATWQDAKYKEPCGDERADK